MKGNEITLNTTIPWEIEVRGNLANLNADLRGLELHSLDGLGVSSQIRLLLSEPAETTLAKTHFAKRFAAHHIIKQGETTK